MANGYSSGERRENVRKQLRDRKGRWIEMGLKVRFSLNNAYAVGKVTGIDGENDEVSVETPDGTTHKLGSKQLESIGAKATIPEQGEAPEQARILVGRTTQVEDPFASHPGTEIQEDVSWYGGNGYTVINGTLRGSGDIYDKPESEPVQKTTQTLRDAVNAYELTEDTTLYRGLGLFSEDTETSELLDSLQPGAVVEDKAFLSTATESSIAAEVSEGRGDTRVLFEINAPAGSKALDVDGFFKTYPSDDSSLLWDEGEIILPPGSKLRVDSRRFDEKTGNWYIKSTLLSGKRLKLPRMEEKAMIEDEKSPAKGSRERHLQDRLTWTPDQVTVTPPETKETEETPAES